MNAVGDLSIASVEHVLADALALTDASLVIFRHGALIEFKTQLLSARLSCCTDPGHRGWQVGHFEGHHCHLDLAAVAQIWFDAAAVSCQRGRLNYTVWFLAARDCGNPFRPDGYFSITLNEPYSDDGAPKREVVDQVHALYRLHRERPGVLASDSFIKCFE